MGPSNFYRIQRRKSATYKARAMKTRLRYRRNRIGFGAYLDNRRFVRNSYPS